MGRAEAASVLCAVLGSHDLPYRERWKDLGVAPRRSQLLNRSAIGRVLAAHLVNVGQLEEVVEADWPRTHKDWLHRCLNPDRAERSHPLDRDALTLFCDAFEFAARHRAHLREQWESPPGTLLPEPGGALGPRLNPEQLSNGAGPPQGYHCLSVLEERFVGPQRLPRLHRSTMLMQADTDGVQHVTYVLDVATDGVTVEVENGGGSTGPVYRLEPGFWAQDIRFDRPLRRGERRRLVCTSTPRPGTPDPTEFRRRGCSHPDTPIEIVIRFDPDCLPTGIVRCLWPGHAAAAIAEAPSELSAGHLARFVVSYVQPGALVGLRWTWPA